MINKVRTNGKRGIKHKISNNKFQRIALKGLGVGDLDYHLLCREDNNIVHDALRTVYCNGFVYVQVKDLSKPVERGVNPVSYRINVARMFL